jgi:hypothetical protein
MALQTQDPIANIRAQVGSAQIALDKIKLSISNQIAANPNDASALGAALQGVLSATSDVETVMTAANAQLVNQAKTIADTQTALTACQANLTAANQKLAQVPKNADGTPAKPGTYFSAPVLGFVAIAAAGLGAFGGYWYKGTTLKKKSLSEAKEEAPEGKRLRK